MKKIKRIAAVHDLSGFGKASLTAAIPILSTIGIQVCPLPTSVLSTITEYPNTQMVDLTDHLSGFIDHWQQLGLKFEAIYSGFLGSPHQVNIVENLIDRTASKDALIVVDPVMGDNGQLYPVFDQKIITAMQILIRSAQVITPNITEAAFLLNEPAKELLDRSLVIDWLHRLAEMNPQIVIITSVPDYEDDTKTCVFAYDKGKKEYWKMSCRYLPGRFPGTGDTFTSIITGYLLQGRSLPDAIEIAVSFVYKAIKYSLDYIEDKREGIYLEPLLPELLKESKLFKIQKLNV